MIEVQKRTDGTIYISKEEIAKRTRELSQQINEDYAGLDLHLICILNGGFLFMADLCREITRPLSMDFLAVSSYGSATETSGEVELIKDLSQTVHGKHVLLVEDIVDTGLTIEYVLNYLKNREPASLKVVSLLSKPTKRRMRVPIDYLGFTIPDVFVYGYGLDRDGFDRNLPFVTSFKGED